MLYDTLADLVVVAHFLFIVYVVFGGLIALRWTKAMWIHLPAMTWGAATEFFGIVCPLTYLENHLRSLGATATYGSSFIERYLVPVVYPTSLTRELQVVLGAALLLINATIYAYLWWRLRKSTS